VLSRANPVSGVAAPAEFFRNHRISTDKTRLDSIYAPGIYAPGGNVNNYRISLITMSDTRQ